MKIVPDMFIFGNHLHIINIISCFVLPPYMNSNKRMTFNVLGFQMKTIIHYKMLGVGHLPLVQANEYI